MKVTMQAVFPISLNNISLTLLLVKEVQYWENDEIEKEL